MIFVTNRFTPVVVICNDETGPDYLVYTTKDRHTVVCDIYSVLGRLHFSTKGNFCLSQNFINAVVKQMDN